MGIEENGPRGEKFRRWLEDELKRRKQQKRRNAEKHGAFSADRTMPGEDPREFEELHSALIDEWKPSGPTEEDAVLNLADLMWRKRRARIFLRCKLLAITRDPEHQAYDEKPFVPAFIEWIRADPEGAFEGQATFLSLATFNYLKENFPRSKYESTSEWTEAVITELRFLLLNAEISDFPSEDDGPIRIERLELEKELKFLSCWNHASEAFEEELKVRERLDADISRAVKHLVQTKATKQMLRQTGALERPDERPKKIAAKSVSKDRDAGRYDSNHARQQ